MQGIFGYSMQEWITGEVEAMHDVVSDLFNAFKMGDDEDIDCPVSLTGTAYAINDEKVVQELYRLCGSLGKYGEVTFFSFTVSQPDYFNEARWASWIGNVTNLMDDGRAWYFAHVYGNGNEEHIKVGILLLLLPQFYRQ